MSTEAVPKSPPLARYLLLAGFIALVLLLAAGLNLNPREVPSPLVNKPAPAFSLPQLHEPEKTLSPAAYGPQGRAKQGRVSPRASPTPPRSSL